MAVLGELLVNIETVLMVAGAKDPVGVVQEELRSVVLEHQCVQVAMVNPVLLSCFSFLCYSIKCYIFCLVYSTVSLSSSPFFDEVCPSTSRQRPKSPLHLPRRVLLMDLELLIRLLLLFRNFLFVLMVFYVCFSCLMYFSVSLSGQDNLQEESGSELWA